MTNEQIAINIMGWEPVSGATGYTWHAWYKIPSGEFVSHDFLNDHNAAMMVVEKMRSDGWKWLSGSVDSGGHYFEFYKDDLYAEFKCYNESICHTICEAALKAKGKSNGS